MEGSTKRMLIDHVFVDIIQHSLYDARESPELYMGSPPDEKGE